MAFTIDALDSAIPSAAPIAQMAADKTFTGYDPSGTTSVTGDPLIKSQNVKQPGTTEAASDPAPTESLTLSPKITALARKEQAQRKREFELSQREKGLSERLAEADKYAQLKAKILAKDYAGAAEDVGIDYNGYTESLLKKQSESNPEEQRYLKVETELENLKKAQEDQTVKEYKANQVLWKQEIARVVSENEEFSSIKELGMEDIVLKHINDSFDEDGLELTAEQAAKEIEDALIERAEKFASITKIKSKFSTDKVLGPPKTNVPKTITQNMTTTSQRTVSAKPFHMMSESEQWAEAQRRYEAQKLAR